MFQKHHKANKEELKNNCEHDIAQAINNIELAYQKRNFIFYCMNIITLIDVDNYFKEEDKEGNDNNISLSCHIEKVNQNEIYYYQYINLTKNNEDIKSNIFYFKCCDNKCKSLSILFLNDEINGTNSNIFKRIQEHDISYDRHSYVINPSKGNKFYNKIMADNYILKNLQLIKFSKYFINMVYFDQFFKEQYKYDIKNTFCKKKEKKMLNKKVKENKNIISENKSKKHENIVHKGKNNNQISVDKRINDDKNKKGEIIEIIDDDI